MPRKLCHWTRKQELELVEFVKQRDFIWKPAGNTNQHIKQKYKAYAEFAAKLGSGNTARSVRDRWVNIRSTFHHNMRRVRKSQLTAKSPKDVYTPCWPLWLPLQFLAVVVDQDIIMNAEPSSSNDESRPCVTANGEEKEEEPSISELKEDSDMQINDLKKLIKDELELDQYDSSEIMIEYERAESIDDLNLIQLQQIKRRTNRSRRPVSVKLNNKNCKKLVDDLISSMKPLMNHLETKNQEDQSYWFFGRHVTERLNAMRVNDAHSASNDILDILMKADSSSVAY